MSSKKWFNIDQQTSNVDPSSGYDFTEPIQQTQKEMAEPEPPKDTWQSESRKSDFIKYVQTMKQALSIDRCPDCSFPLKKAVNISHEIPKWIIVCSQRDAQTQKQCEFYREITPS